MISKAVLRRAFLVLLGMLAIQRLPAQTASLGPAQVDRVLVLKQKRILRLLHGQDVVREYKVALGGSPVGPKKQQGDQPVLQITPYFLPDPRATRGSSQAGERLRAEMCSSTAFPTATMARVPPIGCTTGPTAALP